MMKTSMNETITFPSNVAEKYLSYPRKVLNGDIIACDAIKKQCMRYLSWFERDDMYFSPKSCDKVVNFVQRFKLSSCNNKQFLLTECQKHIIYSIYGFKWKKNGQKVRVMLYMLMDAIFLCLLLQALEKHLYPSGKKMGQRPTDNCPCTISFNRRRQARFQWRVCC